MMDSTAFKTKCYELYQLDWLRAHGYTLQDVFDFVHEVHEEGLDADVKIQDLFLEKGFHGELFACMEEFLDTEYQDNDYMEKVLPPAMYEEYLKQRILENDKTLETLER